MTRTAALSFVTVLLAVACSSVARVPAPGDTVLSVYESGGLCQYGGCSTKWTLSGDGTLRVDKGEDSGQIRQLDPATVVRLVELMDDTDFAAIRRVPFDEECPTAYDGSRLLYTFHTASGEEAVDSCVSTIDPTLELFMLVEGIR